MLRSHGRMNKKYHDSQCDSTLASVMLCLYRVSSKTKHVNVNRISLMVNNLGTTRDPVASQALYDMQSGPKRYYYYGVRLIEPVLTSSRTRRVVQENATYPYLSPIKGNQASHKPIIVLLGAPCQHVD